MAKIKYESEAIRGSVVYAAYGMVCVPALYGWLETEHRLLFGLIFAIMVIMGYTIISFMSLVAKLNTKVNFLIALLAHQKEKEVKDVPNET